LIDHSFETLAAARHALRLVGLRIGAKTDARTWRIEFTVFFKRVGGNHAQKRIVFDYEDHLLCSAHTNRTNKRAQGSSGLARRLNSRLANAPQAEAQEFPRANL